MGRTIQEKQAQHFSTLTSQGGESDGIETPQNGKPDGMYFDNICGSYVHGIFDSAEMQKALVDMLLRRKGLDPVQLQYMDQQVYKEKQFDILADGLRKSLDMELVYRILRKG